MKFAVVALQILIALLVVASLMPLLLFSVPAAQGARVGPAIAIGGLVVIFALLRFIWPPPRR